MAFQRVALGSGTLSKDGAKGLRELWERDANLPGNQQVRLATTDDMAMLGIQVVQV